VIAELERALDRRARERDRAARRGERFGNARLALALVALILVILPLFTKDGEPWLGLIPVAALFVLLGKGMDRNAEQTRRLSGAVRFHEAARDRALERWRDLEDTGAELGGGDLAQDLDLFGKASVFQLLSRCTTEAGRRTLAAWLSTPAPVGEVRRRQAAVTELASKPELAEAMAMASAGAELGPIDDRGLLAWAEGTGDHRGAYPFARPLSVLGIVMPAVLLASVALDLAVGLRPALVVVIVVQAATVMLLRRLTEPRAVLLSGPERVLARFAGLIDVVEQAALEAPRLAEVKARLSAAGRASERIRSLTRIVDLLDARLNMFFALSIGPALLWDLNLTLVADRFRRDVGSSMRGWFEAIGELDALVCLGLFARLRPDYAMPVLTDGCVFRAEGLAHPLIDRSKVVANDLELGGAGSVLLLSGSNMSGKSTLLRSIGVNLVLARMGSPVAARSLVSSDLSLATSVRVLDSLAHGTSHFYAELARIKHIVDLAHGSERPVLYLLDEMLHGTNSRERFIGAVGVIRDLARAGSMGVITTHDLALAKVESELPPGKVENRHFADEITAGEMRFDYRLREGPVASTNALRLMRHIGIDVDFEMDEASLAGASKEFASGARSEPKASEVGWSGFAGPGPDE
jgi:hypothetical protein